MMEENNIEDNLRKAWMIISAVIISFGVAVISLKVYAGFTFWGLNLTVWQMVGIPIGFMLGFLTGLTFMGKVLLSKTKV